MNNKLRINNWLHQSIVNKSLFDINQSSNKNIERLEKYVIDNTFLITVQMSGIGNTININSAQTKLHKSFGYYHANILRNECMKNGKSNLRNKKFQPLAFVAFDIEGSRQNNFSLTTICPHGHGFVLFHEETIDNFFRAQSKNRQIDGGYRIVRPTNDIALIDFKPVNTMVDLHKFLPYAMKFALKLNDNQTNERPYDFFPASSKYFPFWKSRESQLISTATSTRILGVANEV